MVSLGTIASLMSPLLFVASGQLLSVRAWSRATTRSWRVFSRRGLAGRSRIQGA